VASHGELCAIEAGHAADDVTWTIDLDRCIDASVLSMDTELCYSWEWEDGKGGKEDSPVCWCADFDQDACERRIFLTPWYPYPVDACGRLMAKGSPSLESLCLLYELHMPIAPC
jgi:hypothetical protein